VVRTCTYTTISFMIIALEVFTKGKIQFFMILVTRQGFWLLGCSGQSSWLQSQRPGFDSRRYQVFWEVVGLERGPLSLVSTIEELLESKSSCLGLESREYDRSDSSHWPSGTLCSQELAVTSPTSCARWVGVVRSRTQATEFSFRM
jgi:hypothetical protein